MRPAPDPEKLKQTFFNHPLFPALQKKYPDRDYEFQMDLMCEWWLTNKKKLPISITALSNWLRNTKPDPEIQAERRKREIKEETDRRLMEMENMPQADPIKLQALRDKMANMFKPV